MSLVPAMVLSNGGWLAPHRRRHLDTRTGNMSLAGLQQLACGGRRHRLSWGAAEEVLMSQRRQPRTNLGGGGHCYQHAR